MITWTSEETNILKQFYPNMANDELQAIIPNKTWISIYKKAKSLGLSREGNSIEYINRSRARSGSKSSSWKGGTKLTPKGYRQILQKGHHRADKNGYVMEHIIVFERETGIEVPKGCSIHHINGDKTDNRIENLCMMTNGAHTALHNRKGKL